MGHIWNYNLAHDTSAVWTTEKNVVFESNTTFIWNTTVFWYFRRTWLQFLKGRCQKRFSGFCPLRGGYPPCPLSFFEHTDCPLRGGAVYPPLPFLLRKKKTLILALFLTNRTQWVTKISKGQLKGVKSIRKQSFTDFWNSRKILRFNFWKYRGQVYEKTGILGYPGILLEPAHG